MAEKALAEVTAQRDDALELLELSRQENARLTAELDRARSYKALYAAAHHVGFFFGGGRFCGLVLAVSLSDFVWYDFCTVWWNTGLPLCLPGVLCRSPYLVGPPS